jgi:hypothetical protein
MNKVLNQKELDQVMKYAPIICFDQKEPFFPRAVGYTFFEKTGPSFSFNRTISIEDSVVAYAIEYAIYWDYDSTHLYELEHFWVFVGENGQVVDAQGSFHGKYLTVLEEDGSNLINNTHVKIYSQPGKHAFCANPAFFKYVPGIKKSTFEEVGSDGLVVTEKVAKGRYQTSPEVNEAIKAYMQRFCFRPTYQFDTMFDIKEELLMPWEELDKKIPLFLEEELEKIEKVWGKNLKDHFLLPKERF